MKVSLKLEDQHQQNQNQTPILFKAKIPITVFGLPFLSAVSATHNLPSATTSDKLSLSLRTHFPSGPSLKLSYNTPTTTTPTTTAAGTADVAPLTLTLKSGVSLSGSPNNSPLIISANFNFSPQNPNTNPNPNFTIKFTPRLGSFSVRKSIHSSVSDSNKGGGTDGVQNENTYAFVPLDRPINWKELSVDSVEKGSILKGIMVAADTELPVMNRFKVNLRWGVGVSSVSSGFDKRLPYLRVNKIKVERIDDVVEEKVEKKQGMDGEFEMLKGMYSWMSRELSDLQTENREMRRALEDVKSGQPLRQHNGYNGGGSGGGGGGKRAGTPTVEVSDGFEQWKMKKNGGGIEANTQRETKKNGGLVDVESELQRAIMAASS